MYYTILTIVCCYQFGFVQTLRKFIITDDDPSLRIESYAIIHLRGVFQTYFSVQYCTLCAVLMEKSAVLNMKMYSIEI